MHVTPMQIANNTVLAIAIAWVVWQFFSLWRAATRSGNVFPATIPTLFIFAGAIAGVELLHVSPLHLIWLSVVSFAIGIFAITFPFVQALSLNVLKLMLLVSDRSGDEPSPSESAEVQPTFESPATTKSNKPKGFGD